MEKFSSYLKSVSSRYGQKILNFLQVCVSFATILGVIFAFHSFNQTLELQRETYVIQLYASYADLSEKHFDYEKSTVTGDSTKWDDAYQAYAHRVLFICESIINIRGGSPEWENTVKKMLFPHLQYYIATNAVKDNFSSKFQDFFSHLNEHTM